MSTLQGEGNDSELSLLDYHIDLDIDIALVMRDISDEVRLYLPAWT